MWQPLPLKVKINYTIAVNTAEAIREELSCYSIYA